MRRWPFCSAWWTATCAWRWTTSAASLAPLNHLVRLPLDMVKLDRQADRGRGFGGPATGGAGVAAFASATRWACRSWRRALRRRNNCERSARMGCALGQGPLSVAAAGRRR